MRMTRSVASSGRRAAAGGIPAKRSRLLPGWWARAGVGGAPIKCGIRATRCRTRNEKQCLSDERASATAAVSITVTHATFQCLLPLAKRQLKKIITEFF